MADSPPTNRNGDFITGQIGTAVVAWLCSIEWWIYYWLGYFGTRWLCSIAFVICYSRTKAIGLASWVGCAMFRKRRVWVIYVYYCSNIELLVWGIWKTVGSTVIPLYTTMSTVGSAYTYIPRPKVLLLYYCIIISTAQYRNTAPIALTRTPFVDVGCGTIILQRPLVYCKSSSAGSITGHAAPCTTTNTKNSTCWCMFWWLICTKILAFL